MKKSTKFFSLLLTGLLLIGTLFGCDEDDKPKETTTAATTTDEKQPAGEEVTDKLTQENLFQTVSEKMGQLKSSSMTATMNLNMYMMGISMVGTMDLSAIADVEHNRYLNTTNVQMLGENETAVNYFDEEIYYVEAGGEKRYADMDAETLKSIIEDETADTELDPDFFESFKLYSSEEGYLLVISGLKEGSGLLDAALNAAMTEGMEVNLGEVEIEITISKECLITNMKISMSMSMNIDDALEDMGEMQLGDVSASIEMEISYADFNEAADKLIKPDMTGAEKFDLDDLLGGFTEDVPLTGVVPSTEDSIVDEL